MAVWSVGIVSEYSDTSDMCSPGEMCAPKHIFLVISVPQADITRVRSFPCRNISDMCFHLQSLHLQILTVTEGFIVGLFFIQAPQEWMKANTKAFLNHTMFDMKKDDIGISFCSGSVSSLFFRIIFLLVHMIYHMTIKRLLHCGGILYNIPPQCSNLLMVM